MNFSHTYGQPIIHGKTVSESNVDRKRLANEIANAAQNKVVVTGIEDEVDIKTFTMSNSEKIYTGLIEFVNREVSNLVLGSESMAAVCSRMSALPKPIKIFSGIASRCTAVILRTS